MKEKDKALNALPKLARKAQETGSGLIIDQTTDLSKLLGLPDTTDIKLSDNPMDEQHLKNGGRLVIDCTGRIFAAK